MIESDTINLKCIFLSLLSNPWGPNQHDVYLGGVIVALYSSLFPIAKPND